MTDHPMFSEAAKFSDNPDAARQEVGEVAALHFTLLPPTGRVEALANLNNAIGAEDGTNLKQKAQLLTLRRELTQMHKMLRRANR